MEMVNWRTTSVFLKAEPLKPIDKLPFNTFMGWKEERKNAG
jgi:hypothetical protein